MSGLAISDAPPPGIPLRFLVAAVLWGAFAGVWIAGQGSEGLATRWTPATVVLVHILMLGVMGNAMLGALAQFLPVAAASRLRGAGLVPLLHAVFNAGVVAFVVAMSRQCTAAMPWVAALLGVSLSAFAGIAGWSLWCGGGPRWLRGGIGMSLAALASTAALGVIALMTLAGRWSVELGWLVDVHAATGMVGSALTLVAVIGVVTLPMLQGTRTPPVALLRSWLALVAAGLLAGAWMRHAGQHGVLVLTATVATWGLAAASLFLQWTARHRRNPTLSAFWALGMIAMAAAAALLTCPLPDGIDRAMLVGTLALAIGLPFVVVGMMLEIVGFLAWIHLRRVVPRGRQIPGVGRLLTEADKRWVLAAHVLAAACLLTTVMSQRGHVVAGVALALAWLTTLAALVRCLGRVRDVQASTA